MKKTFIPSLIAILVVGAVFFAIRHFDLLELFKRMHGA